MVDRPPHIPKGLSPPVGHRTDCATRSTFEDPSNHHHQPGLRHLGITQVRARTGGRFTETINDYLDIFQELQIDPFFHRVFWRDVIYRYRQGPRHVPLLKRGTDASIRNMTDHMLRAYGERIWGPHSGWRSGLAAGEQRLLYEKGGANKRLREIFGKMWWRMRELVYEEKPPPKQGGRSGNASLRGKTMEGDALSEADETYLADIDDSTPQGTDSEAGTHIAPSKIARARTLGKLHRVADKVTTPDTGNFLTSQETEDEILGLIERLHDLRLASKPDVFERLWAAHIGRIEEIEAPLEEEPIADLGPGVDDMGHPLNTTVPDAGKKWPNPDVRMEDELFASVGIRDAHNNHVGQRTASQGDPRAARSNAAALPFPTQLVSDAEIKKRIYPNYSSEPFHTSGNPVPPSMTQQHRMPPSLPTVMSIWITTAPPHGALPNRAYHHPAAPAREQDMVAFFRQVMERAERVAEKDVQGYALSYGWCDVSRWIAKTVGRGGHGVGDGASAGESEGERLGWEVFQKDLLAAARAGVTVWRMKVLVVRK